MLHLHPTLWCPSVEMLALRGTSVNRSDHSSRNVWISVACLRMNKAASFPSFFSFSFCMSSASSGILTHSECAVNQLRHYLHEGKRWSGKVQFTLLFKPSVSFLFHPLLYVCRCCSSRQLSFFWQCTFLWEALRMPSTHQNRQFIMATVWCYFSQTVAFDGSFTKARNTAWYQLLTPV